MIKVTDSYAHQNALCQRQRMVAAQLIKEKHRLQKELSSKCAQIEQLESKLGLKSSPSALTSDRPISVSLHVSVQFSILLCLLLYCFSAEILFINFY